MNQPRMTEIRHGHPAVVLAPMEGVTDAPMRALVSERGGFSYCVSEFLRVSQDAPSPKVFRSHIPELMNSGMTRAGLPVQIQLLGGDPEKLAQAALNACEAGAHSIDLNFGCPAPTVNRHDGGATLLKYPDRIRAIVSAVRAAVPRPIPVSAKLRLGFDDMNSIHLNAEMAALGGASWITIHGRTKVQGYTPPAYWEPIGEVRRNLDIPVVANGEIWTLDDFKRCRDETGSEHFMLGRGFLADPSLPSKISRELGILTAGSGIEELGISASRWTPVLRRFTALCTEVTENDGYATRRIKQWMRYVHSRQPAPWYDALKRLGTTGEILSLLESHP